MSCFPCFSRKKTSDKQNVEPVAAQSKEITRPPPPVFDNKPTPPAEVKSKTDIFGAEEENSTAKAFNFRELATATKNFRQENLLGEGGFGRVFKATLPASGQIVAVRRLDRGATQGSKEFQVEVLVLSLLSHPNLVKMIGYCADGDQRLLVYEYMPSGSLEKHLFDIPANKKPLLWSERMKIASGIAQGLEYLHEKANPPIIYRDLKSSSIMLDEMNNPRLSGYGLAKLLQSGSSMNVLPRVMAAYGNCAPEYEKNGELTVKSDVYSFGVILLEIITGRRALDTTQPAEEQNLVSWAQPIFSDPNRYPDMADPLMKKQFPVTSLNQAVGVAAMCLQEEPMVRPLIGDIVAALSFLALSPPEAPIPARLVPILSGRVESVNHRGNRPSFGERTMSIRKKEDTSYREFEDKKIHPIISKDNEQQDGSENSNSLVNSDKSIDNLKQSEKSGSNTKQENKVESQGMSGPLETRSVRVGSIGSQDSSLGFSARFEDSFKEQNVPSNPRQVKFQDSFDYDAGLSSDEECSKDTLDSSSQPRPQDRKKSINSRSNKNLQNKDINTNVKQGIPTKSSDSDFNPK